MVHRRCVVETSPKIEVRVIVWFPCTHVKKEFVPSPVTLSLFKRPRLGTVPLHKYSTYGRNRISLHVVHQNHDDSFSLSVSFAHSLCLSLCMSRCHAPCARAQLFACHVKMSRVRMWACELDSRLENCGIPSCPTRALDLPICIPACRGTLSCPSLVGLKITMLLSNKSATFWIRLYHVLSWNA